jgi:prepilin-type N-terminal cleavage/methylation domain-containing protein
VRLAPEHQCLQLSCDGITAEGTMFVSRCRAVLRGLCALRGESSFSVVGPRRRAFTVIELIVVMGIVAVMAVLTIMSFSAMGKRSSRAGAADNIKGLLRAAQTAAVDSGLGSLVRIDTRERSLHGIANTVQAAWHFENQTAPAGLPPGATGLTAGAKSMDGIVYRATAGQQGVAGLSFGFNATNQQYVDCGTYPVYDQTEGIRIEAYVRPQATTGDYMGVIAKCLCPLGGLLDSASGGYILGVSRSGSPSTYRVHAGFVVTDAAGTPGLIYLFYPPPPGGDPREFRDGEWHNIAAEFDGYEARLFIDGVPVYVTTQFYRKPPFPSNPPVAFVAPAQIVPARSQALTVGAMHYGMPPFVPVNDYYFQGLIDEPQVLSVAGGSHFKLPEGVPLVSSVGVVHYNGQGQLDIAYHSAPVYVSVGDPYQTAVLGNDTGGTLVLQGSNPFPPTGGAVIVGGPSGPYEVVTYASVTGLTLNVPPPPPIPLPVDPGALGRGSYGTTASVHAARETVYFARTVKVGATGLVEQIGSTP